MSNKKFSKFNNDSISDIRKEFIREVQKLAAEKNLLFSVNNIKVHDNSASFRARLFIIGDFGIPKLSLDAQYHLNKKAVEQGIISEGDNIYGREFFSPDDNLWMVIGLSNNGAKPYQLLNLKDNSVIRANSTYIKSGIWITDIEDLDLEL